LIATLSNIDIFNDEMDTSSRIHTVRRIVDDINSVLQTIQKAEAYRREKYVRDAYEFQMWLMGVQRTRMIIERITHRPPSTIILMTEIWPRAPN